MQVLHDLFDHLGCATVVICDFKLKLLEAFKHVQRLELASVASITLAVGRLCPLSAVSNALLGA